jgi:class 3 adenylate cyclase
VTGLGGHVLKKLGDGLMVLFGYPQAEENDAERAVRAALAIQRALEELNERNAGAAVPQLVARIGLESGPVIVDGVRGSAKHRRASSGSRGARDSAGHLDRPAAGRRAGSR